MKRLVLSIFALTLSIVASAQDPNFHIYLCFGQSNMQGKAKIEAQDKENVPERFQMMATVDNTSMGRKAGQWYTAVPPIVRPETGIGVTDYFGRELVENLPDSVKVGVIAVAVDGCSIAMYNEDECKTYIVGKPDYMTSAAKAYDNNPFRRLVDLGKQAQKDGVIKGILIHQGETDMGDMKWNLYVQRIYTRLLNELGLKAIDVPLLAGEALRAEYGGVCAQQIQNVARLKNAIPNVMVATSEGCTNTDQYHFSTEGYRIIGRRYGRLMLDYLKSYETKVEVEAKDMHVTDDKVVIDAASSKMISMLPATFHKFRVMVTDAEGTEHDVTSACRYEVEDPSMLSVKGPRLVSGQKTGSTLVTATYTDKAGKVLSLSFHVGISLFSFGEGFFNPSVYMDGTLKEGAEYATFKSSTNGFGGWTFEEGLDLTATPYVMVEFAHNPSKNSKVLFLSGDNYLEGRCFFTLSNTSKSQVIDLRTLKDTKGNLLDLSHVRFIGLFLGSTPTLYPVSVQLSADGETPASVFSIENAVSAPCFDLQGRQVASPSRGLYIKNGKKVLVK